MLSKECAALNIKLKPKIKSLLLSFPLNVNQTIALKIHHHSEALDCLVFSPVVTSQTFPELQTLLPSRHLILFWS